MPNNKDFIKTVLKNMVDDLNRLLIVILFILILVTIFVRNFYLDIIKILVLVIIIIRITSKNKTKRYQENQKYLSIKKGLIKPFTNMKSNLEKKKNNVYKKCHKCKTILKLPLPPKRGILHAKCPNCGNRVTLLTFRKKQEEKIKVEVIKKSRKGE